jgi:NAD-dependent dihydropyrimidine dehydrogenase PreA subunit
MENKKARIANKEVCMECGACAKNCPTAAITVHSGVG